MAQYDLFQTKSPGSDIDIDQYMERIDCMREYRPSLRFLKKLLRQHQLHIPFENLDIHIGNQIILEVNRVFDKIIGERRGGFCYELNGLFYHLLLELGFEAKLISARVFSEDGTLGQEFDHMAIIVFLDEQQWLVDVGFGRSFMSPIEFVMDKIQMIQNEYFKIVELPDHSYKLQSSYDSFSFTDEYTFTKKPRQFVEFIGMCQYHQTSPKSHFTRKKVISQTTKEGRLTLSDDKFIVNKMGKKEEFPVLNNDQFLVLLKEHFGITLRRKK